MLSSFRPLLPLIEEKVLGQRGDAENDEHKDQQYPQAEAQAVIDRVYPGLGGPR